MQYEEEFENKRLRNWGESNTTVKQQWKEVKEVKKWNSQEVKGISRRLKTN